MPKIIADETIFQAAIQTVIARGYAGATTKEIAAAAGVSEVTLFRKYGTKGQLVQEAIAAMVRETDFPAAAYYTGDIQADLTRVVQAYQTAVERHGHFFPTLLADMPRYPELAEVLDAPLEMISHIGRLLARYQEEGMLRPEHPLHAVAALLGPLMITTMIRSTPIENTWLPAVDLPTHIDHFLAGRRL